MMAANQSPRTFSWKHYSPYDQTSPVWTNFEAKFISIDSLFQLESIQQQISQLQAELKESDMETAIQPGPQIAGNPLVQTIPSCVRYTTLDCFKKTEGSVAGAVKVVVDPHLASVDSQDENPPMAVIEGGMGQEEYVPRPVSRESAFIPFSTILPLILIQDIDERSACSFLAATEATRGVAANEERHQMAATQAQQGRRYISPDHEDWPGPQRQESELNCVLVRSEAIICLQCFNWLNKISSKI
jgi:hypothetical protein